MNSVSLNSVVRYEDLTAVPGLIGPLNISTERYREYVQADGTTYRIDNPVALYRREGGTTHRVVDVEGVVHCVPCGALHPAVVIRWKNRDINQPVNW